MISKPSAASIKDLLARLARDEDGGELVESVLVVGLIAVACLIAMKAVGFNINMRWSDITNLM
jgi:Flp pilus assembly pilin Flp